MTGFAPQFNAYSYNIIFICTTIRFLQQLSCASSHDCIWFNANCWYSSKWSKWKHRFDTCRWWIDVQLWVSIVFCQLSSNYLHPFDSTHETRNHCIEYMITLMVWMMKCLLNSSMPHLPHHIHSHHLPTTTTSLCMVAFDLMQINDFPHMNKMKISLRQFTTAGLFSMKPDCHTERKS